MAEVGPAAGVVQPLTYPEQLGIMALGSAISAVAIIPLATFAGMVWGRLDVGFAVGLVLSGIVSISAIIGGSIASYADHSQRTRQRRKTRSTP